MTPTPPTPPTTTQSRSTISLVRLLAEYLRLRHAAGPRDARLQTFERLLGEPASTGTRRLYARVPLRLGASLATGPLRLPVRVVDLGGGGVRVEMRGAALPGWLARFEMRVPDEERRVDHVFDCHVRWARRGHAGLCFVGLPRREPHEAIGAS